jgi:SAM-dependent methyltransferase
MSTETVYHAYNDVVAALYDLDPQNVTGDSLDRAVHQLRQHWLFGDGTLPLRVLDLGMGTGMFLAKLKTLGCDQIVPFGLDLADNMVANARRKIPDLVAEVDDAANFDAYFPGQLFDCVSTHFITGFVPMQLLAPKIWNRLEEGGYWSFVGGTKEGFPGLQAKARSKVVRWLGGSRGEGTLDEVLINPANESDVVHMLEANGFETLEAETFEPTVSFRDFNEFMEFGYQGGWFTPIIESVELHKIGAVSRWLLNRFVFPVIDHHSIAIVLARKVIK